VSKLPRYYTIIINTWLGFIIVKIHTHALKGRMAGWLTYLLGGLNSYHPIAMGTLIATS
jgi:hypothetical protein